MLYHQEVEPPEALRHAIKCLWYTSLDFGELPSTFEILPDGYAELVFHFGSATCSVSTPGGWQTLPSPSLMGLLNQLVLLRAQHQLEVIGIRCFPWTVFELLGLPPGQDRLRHVEHPIAQLQPALAECLRVGCIADALAQVAQYLTAAQPLAASDQLLRKAGTAMRQAHGTLPVRQVAAAAHTTVRTLERKFKHSAGRTVKDVSGLMRFEQVRNHLWLHPDANLAGLAQELGYTDQAHLSREFKRYSGTTPAAFAKAKQGQAPISSNFVALVSA